MCYLPEYEKYVIRWVEMGALNLPAYDVHTHNQSNVSMDSIKLLPDVYSKNAVHQETLRMRLLLGFQLNAHLRLNINSRSVQ